MMVGLLIATSFLVFGAAGLRHRSSGLMERWWPNIVRDRREGVCQVSRPLYAGIKRRICGERHLCHSLGASGADGNFAQDR
jgi:hypothetical protein